MDLQLKEIIAKKWKETLANDAPAARFPLVRTMYGEEEIEAMFDCILSGRITYGPKVEEFERLFAQELGSKYAVMVNSGSSANLLAFACMMNPARKRHLVPGDAVLVPAVCWSTSLFPIMQLGCKPVLVDVDPLTCNIDLDDLRAKAVETNAKAIVAVHVIGNSCDMRELLKLTKELDLIVMEDTCESMGSYAEGPDGKKQCLGTFGAFGTFSMYFAHHITCGEGGVVLCQTEEDYELAKCLRAHGWTRHLSPENRAAAEAKHSEVDARFLFVNTGFNLRPMSIQAVMGTVQVKQLHKFNDVRRDIYRGVRQRIEADKRFQNQFDFVTAAPGVDPAWFGVAVILKPAYFHQYSAFIKHLGDAGVETRPIISGNMARQPCLALYDIKVDAAALAGAERIHKGGLFIGVHNRPIGDSEMDWVADVFMQFEFKAQA